MRNISGVVAMVVLAGVVYVDKGSWADLAAKPALTGNAAGGNAGPDAAKQPPKKEDAGKDEGRSLKGQFACGAEGMEPHTSHYYCVKSHTPVFFAAGEGTEKTCYLIVGAREKKGSDLKPFDTGKATQKKGEVELSVEILPAQEGFPSRAVVYGEEWILKAGGKDKDKDKEDGAKRKGGPAGLRRIGEMGKGGRRDADTE